MFDKILIANRGVIACRIARTLGRMGVGSVAIHSQADRHSLHVTQASEAVSIGDGTVAETYLSVERILDAACKTGAGAIHPGYGFLSENPDFAEACAAAGIVFIGPQPEQMRAFGRKHRAREIAAAAKVPLAPGGGLLSGIDDARIEAARIGYPVMMKSTAGGGGIGLQLCRAEAEIGPLFERVSRLARNNFGDGGVYLEKYVERARHIEVQIFGDGRGTVVALGERDCSAQRRHQKIVEETPAPGLADATRRALHETAIRLGRAVDYENAGTVEFLYDVDAASFYFLEVNTRLQVEHGVTEEVTGVDLVEWMVRQAAGETLPLEEPIRSTGHAIQVRLYAEDPGRNFRPSAGLVTQARFPSGARVETWIENGSEISSLYDPMLAKLIVTAGDRNDAVARLRRALADTAIAGIETNLDYLRRLLDHPALVAGEVTTATLERLDYRPATIEVLAPGTQTTIQDWPGRLGYWGIGVPPSGPMD
ncbi:MAG: urea carboxylase, partial [Alphaproteobacteria bacterium]|nr:urea carboxylase [Alphaproteobacteria bacterium]